MGVSGRYFSGLTQPVWGIIFPLLLVLIPLSSPLAQDIQLCMRSKGSGDVPACGWGFGDGVEGCSGFATAGESGAISRLDDTAGSSNCALSWRIKSTQPGKASLRVCVESSSAEQGACLEEGVRCSEYSDTNNDRFSADTTDRTGRRFGECAHRFRIEPKDPLTTSTPYVWRICWSSARSGVDECNGLGVGKERRGCSGWSNAPAWSEYLHDRSSATPGGCQQRFWLERLAIGSTQVVACSDRLDNDGDGAVDYPADAGCSGSDDTDEGYPQTSCQDSLDNDRDGLIDLGDPGCLSSQDTSEDSATAQCQDSFDNDRDGATDFPADFSCTQPLDNDEGEPKSQCQDGVDNDRDGAVDLLDRGCSGLQDPDESDTATECRDGGDNDRDGLIDGEDPGCWSDRGRSATYLASRDNESIATSQCQDGNDNDGDGVSDMLDPGCSAPTGNDESSATTECQDSRDNDGDGVVDAKDPGCWGDVENPLTYSRVLTKEARATTECQDNRDNDRDLAVDALDPGCWKEQRVPASFDPTRIREGEGTTQCQDTLDNDQDGATDRGDPGCWGDKGDPLSYEPLGTDESRAVPLCQDGIDNDGDGKIDLKDPGCVGAIDLAEEDGQKECGDGIDNDRDILVDRADPGCWSDGRSAASYDPARSSEGVATSECGDRIDNDGDTLIDNLDPGCWRVPDAPSTYQRDLSSEARATAACQDTVDNDGDTLIDLADPGCLSARDTNEGDGTRQCQDRLDNDSDGLIDASDPGCRRNPRDPASYDPLGTREADASSQCQNFLDDDGDSLVDMSDPGCSRKQDDSEGDGTSQCQDRLDNDGDGLIDALDMGCWRDQQSAASYDKTLNTERYGSTACQDGKDNDGDGAIDLSDGGCTSILDTDESDDLASIQLSTECVQDNKDGTFTAYLTYHNLTGRDQTVPIGAGTTTANTATPGASNRGQPTLFRPGKNRGAFVVTFSGTELTWSVRTQRGAVSTTSASPQSVACLPLTPRVECIDGDSKGFRATLGYENPNPFDCIVPSGALNQVTGASTSPPQVTRFLPGSNRGIASVPFATALSWLLTGNTATVSAATPICLGGCVETPVQQVATILREGVADLGLLSHQAGDAILARLTRRVPKAERIRIQGVVRRAKRAATAFVATTVALISEFPAVEKSCPFLLPACATTDNTLRIQKMRERIAAHTQAIQRLGTDSSSRRVAPQATLKGLRARAKTIERRVLDTLGYLPRSGVRCK